MVMKYYLGIRERRETVRWKGGNRQEESGRSLWRVKTKREEREREREIGDRKGGKSPLEGVKKERGEARETGEKDVKVDKCGVAELLLDNIEWL